MARSYDTPPDTNEKEKPIGGILTFTQFFWLLGGAVLGIASYFLIYVFFRTQILAIPFALIITCSGIPFAFKKKHEMTLYTYLMTKRQFDKKTKKLINRRKF